MDDRCSEERVEVQCFGILQNTLHSVQIGVCADHGVWGNVSGHLSLWRRFLFWPAEQLWCRGGPPTYLTVNREPHKALNGHQPNHLFQRMGISVYDRISRLT